MPPLRLVALFAIVAVAGCAGTRDAVPPDAPPSTVVQEADTARSGYAALGPQVRAAVEAGYHTPPEFESERWRRFWRDVDRALAEARTDREVSARFRAAADTLGVSHLEVYRRAASDAPEPASSSARPSVSLDIRDDGVAVLTVDEFGLESTARSIVEAFHTVAAQDPPALIMDLRRNPGGDLSAMLVAGHLISEPVQAGLFLSRRWWDTHDTVPPPAEWESLPLLTEPDLNAFFRALSEEGAVVGVVPSMEPRYDGPVYVLTSGQTGSAAEPLVHLLKASGRATVVGERTAGAMLSSTEVDLEDGWVVRFPAADYFTAEGTRLEGVGVTPDAAVPAEQALEEAIRLASELD